MPSHAFTDRPAAGTPEPGPVDALIAQARRLRGGMDAVRAQPQDPRADEVRARWQRALCELAMHHLDDLDDHLAQLRAGARPPRPAARGGPDESLPHRVGGAEWNLLTDEVSWSPELYAIVGRDPATRPLTLDELPSLVHPEDQPRLTAMVTGCLIDGKPIDGEFRLTRPDGSSRTVHMTGEPVLDTDGATASMWAVLRDVSALRRGERALRETRHSLDRRDREELAERHAADALREAVLPAEHGPVRFSPEAAPGALDLAVVRLPAVRTGPPEGHWHEALELPGGQTVLAVGELSGRGVPLAAATATLLGALRGTALAGLGPGQTLDCLDQLVAAGAGPTPGSALCCRYDPRTGLLTWAHAGHPAPLLFRGGEVRELLPPQRPLLGDVPMDRHAEAGEPLLPGDLVVLRTGSPVPAPGTDLADRRLPALAPAFAAARTAQECARLLTEEFASVVREDDGYVLFARVRDRAG
ncbi:SpoIIE family protein phosphatase [Streptomyces sp. NPDC049954]|uniref:PP2C family protein-serine/threonine phosphatase n=1 Tax=Streptomyces sp. NPDC049954 TaxID=3155779 RepID=UPI00341A0C9D